MNPQPEQELEQLRQLEAEINAPASVPVVVEPKSQTTQTSSTLTLLYRFVNWFNSLPSVGKLIVVAVALVVGLAVLRAVLKLVAALISLAFLAVLLYFAYQFLLARTSETKN